MAAGSARVSIAIMWRTQCYLCLLPLTLLWSPISGGVSTDHHRERRQLMICKSEHCQELVKRLKSNKSFYKYYVNTYCENGRCEDTVSEWSPDGAKRIHICNEFGCAQSNNAQSNVRVNNDGVPQNPNKLSIVCQSLTCKDFISKLKAEVPFPKYDIETTCLNNICEDEITVEYSNDSKDYFVCRRDGCSIKGTPAVPVRTTTTPTPTPAWTTTKTTTTTTATRLGPRGPCSTSTCQEYFDRMVAYKRHSELFLKIVCDDNGNCKDILIVMYDNGQTTTVICDTTSCKEVDASEKRPVESTSVLPTKQTVKQPVEPTSVLPTKETTVESTQGKQPSVGFLQSATNQRNTALTSTSPSPSSEPTSGQPLTQGNSSSGVTSEKVCRLPSDSDSSPRLYCPLSCSECSPKPGGSCHLSGGSVAEEPVTRIQCPLGYRLADDRNDTLVACHHGQWQGQFSECLPLCPALESESMIPTCTHNGKEVDCEKPTLPGTTAAAQCRPGYSPYQSYDDADEDIYGRTLRCSTFGEWSASLPECKPNCGISKGSAIVEATVALGGLSTPLGVFPWHAGLYQKEDGHWKYICGGSLITKQVVVSAAHCIQVSSFEDLRVTFAKYYREWDKDEKDTVKRNVSNIRTPKEFSAAITTLLWDIALILLSEPVKFNSFVMPVCIGSINIDPTLNFMGYVVGWGKTTADGEESEYLLHNNVSVVLKNSCERNAAKLVTFDKFCASKDATSVVEKGDSGGGLTVVYKNKHYLLGIVSVKYNKVSMFTNFTWTTHVNWRKTEVAKFEDNLSRCPKKSGFLCGLTGPCLSKSVRCDGYQQCPDGTDEFRCPTKHGAGSYGSGGGGGGGGYDGQSGPLCGLPSLLEHGNYTLWGNRSAQFSVAYACHPGYKKDKLSSVGKCISRGYFVNFVECVPTTDTVCGVPDNHDAYKDGDRFPWSAVLYIRGNGSRWEHYCAGTLVSKQFVLTAARCVVNPRVVDHPDNIKVGLGKYRGRIVSDPYGDKQDSVIVDVDDTAVPQFYSGSANKYAADIGLVHLKAPANLGDFVMPICLQYNGYGWLGYGWIFKVPTWGTPKNGADAEPDLSSNVKYIDNPSCFKELKPDNQPLITYDKYCATYVNGTSIGNLEIGAGVYFESQGQYYTYGVVSAVIKEGDAPPVALITYVYNEEHFDWLQLLLDRDTMLQDIRAAF